MLGLKPPERLVVRPDIRQIVAEGELRSLQGHKRRGSDVVFTQDLSSNKQELNMPSLQCGVWFICCPKTMKFLSIGCFLASFVFGG